MNNIKNFSSFSEKKDENAYSKKDEAKTIKETQEHIDKVNKYINIFIDELKERGKNHDKPKLSKEELPMFVEYTPKLAKSTYGTPEYKKLLDGLKPALDHHYKNCSHHPEHYDNGIKGMDLVDIVEMFCDWKAASERHDNGKIEDSLKINKERFKMDDILTSIYTNSIKYVK